ncbi:MAG: hydroxymethylglutaryl-CoA reductase, degradative [Candidatus Lokiarchaeota archaeon]|nr:hydroxymethylglutaryl-CoA reductase, degradative [Candidatus Lokiarchaeota archaeon]
MKNSAPSSRLPGFHNLSIKERQEIIKKLSGLTNEEIDQLNNFGNLGMELGIKFSENVIGGYTLPISIATNFQINSKDYLVPMVTEESSVVAAASYGAKLARKYGGFVCDPLENLMIGQLQILLEKRDDIENFIRPLKSEFLRKINEQHSTLSSVGGGAKELRFRKIQSSRGGMGILELEVDVVDAMGANIVNSMMETLGKLLQRKYHEKIRAKIVSNLAIGRICKCKAIFDTEEMGRDVAHKLVDIYAFAEADPYRAVTHNKGIMNGIIALALATGNDTRALEAAAHGYASIDGKYRPLSRFYLNEEGNLVGSISVPLPMGIIGGITSMNPVSRIALKILGISTATELIQIASAVGLAQNISALRALADEGIQKSHMRLHARKFENRR